jgi:hypothetical protein
VEKNDSFRFRGNAKTGIIARSLKATLDSEYIEDHKAKIDSSKDIIHTQTNFLKIFKVIP